jgi:hypothetical protein
MTTIKELKDELELYLLEKISDIDMELDEETAPLLEAKDNSSDPDHTYATQEFEHLLKNSNKLKSLINGLLDKLNNS